MSKALGTDLATPKQQTVGTHHAEIVQSLNDRNMGFAAGIVNRRSKRWKQVVDVHEIRLESDDSLRDKFSGRK
jgi:hypothetical protein